MFTCTAGINNAGTGSDTSRVRRIETNSSRVVSAHNCTLRAQFGDSLRFDRLGPHGWIVVAEMHAGVHRHCIELAHRQVQRFRVAARKVAARRAIRGAKHRIADKHVIVDGG